MEQHEIAGLPRLAQRQAAKFTSAAGNAEHLPSLAQRQAAVCASRTAPPAHDQHETPREARLRLSREAAARRNGRNAKGGR